MRTRRSPRNQDALYRQISTALQRAADGAAGKRSVVARYERLHACGHTCDCRDPECPCSTPGECPAPWMRDEVRQ